MRFPILVRWHLYIELASGPLNAVFIHVYYIYIYTYGFVVFCFVVIIFCISCWDPRDALIHILQICVFFTSTATIILYEINLNSTKPQQDRKYRMANISWRACVFIKQIQYNPRHKNIQIACIILGIFIFLNGKQLSLPHDNILMNFI